MMNDTIIYYPTPLEQAYSLYVVQQVFHLAPTVPLRISGRSAVPFLTQSGVNRMTLRSIWTAADPQNIGTLTELTQFQLLLRLVSMAQFGILEAQGTAESMREAVQHHATMRLALPIFSSVVIPPHENLLTMYGMFVIQYQSQSQDILSVYPGVGSVASFGAASIVSVDDAFSDLGPTENAPLPSLDEVTSLMAQPSASKNEEGVADPDPPSGVAMAVTDSEPASDEFGDFEDVPPAENVSSSTNISIPTSIPAQDQSTMMALSFDGSVESSHIPSNSTQHSSHDGFGGFSTAPVTTQNHFGHAPQSSFDGSVLSSFNDVTHHINTQTSLESTSDYHAPALSGFEKPNLVTNQIEFGSFGGTMISPSFDGSVQSSSHFNPTTGGMITETTITTPASITDAFGDIGVEDAPLPSLDQLTGRNINHDDNPNHEDFGDFEATTLPSDSVELGMANGAPTNGNVPSSSPLASPGSDLFSMDSQNVTGFQIPPSSAMERECVSAVTSLVPPRSTTSSVDQAIASIDETAIASDCIPSQDVLLTPLEPVSMEIKDSSIQQDGDDDFGGFEDAHTSDINRCNHKETNSEPISTIASPVLLQKNDNDFEFKDWQATSQEFDKSDAVVSNVENSLAFDSATTQSAIREISTFNQASSIVTDGFDDSDPFSAFNTIAPISQPELPPLTMTFSLDNEHNQTELVEPECAGDDDDDFGEFTSTNAHPIDPAQEKEIYDDFGDFESSSNVPLPAPLLSGTSKDPFTTVNAAPPTSVTNDPLGLHHVLSQPFPENRHDLENAGTLAPDEVDLFASFDSNPTVKDTFGAFDSSTAHTVPVHSGDDLFRTVDDITFKATADSLGPGDDEFGAFVAPTTNAPSIIANDLFSNSDATSSATLLEPHGNPIFVTSETVGTTMVSTNDQDDWGDFNVASSVEPGETAINQDTLELPEPSPASDGDWGEFDDARPPPCSNNLSKADDEALLQGTNDAARETSTNDWGAFDAFGDAKMALGESEDGFGTFETVLSVSQGTESEAATRQDPFDDFGGTSNQASEVKLSQDDNGEFDDDWGDFENVEMPSLPESNSLQEQIRGLSMPLTENILRKAGASGSHVDLGECFEVHIGTHAPMEQNRKVRVERAMQVLEILSKMNHNHGYMYWEQVMKVVKNELDNGYNVLYEAKALSRSDVTCVAKPLQSMIAGLREFVRVVRSIVATIGDMLMLDPNALLTVDTMASTWCSLAILPIALEIEMKWKSILKEMQSLVPSSAEVDAPTIDDIRSRVQEWYPNDNNLCELTLQPLLPQNKSTTLAAVTWNGRKFLACSGNLLANRCPFYLAAK